MVFTVLLMNVGAKTGKQNISQIYFYIRRIRRFEHIVVLTPEFKVLID